MVIADNRNVPKTALMAIAAVGWVAVIYLAYVVGLDSWNRTGFAIAALSGGLPEVDPFNQRYVDHPWLTMAHTVPGVLFSILGPLQFMSPVRRKFTALHRLSGRIFVVIGMVSGLGAIVMGFVFPIWGLTVNQATTLVAGAFMVFALAKAFGHIKARRIAVHREWMIRAFATGLAVAVFRVAFRDVLLPAGFEFTTAWNIVVTGSFPLTLAVAELWIRATRPKGRAAVPASVEAAPAVG